MRTPSPLMLVSLIGSLMMLAALATDIMLPAFPTMARDLAVSSAAIQQVISIFMLGYALPHLIIGSLADRFGRRRVLLAGLFIYGLGSILCLLAPNFVWLLAGRFVQGVGAAAGPILARAILRDLYQGSELGRMLSFAMVFFAAGPILAPVIGAVMLQFTDWHQLFTLLFIVAVLLILWVWRSLPETSRQLDVKALDFRHIISNAKLIFGHSQSGLMVLLLSFAYATLLGYLISAPIIFIEFYGVSEATFALLFASVASVAFVTQPLNAHLLKRQSPAQIMKVVLLLYLLVSTIMLLQVASGYATLTSLTINLAAFFACFTLIIANGTAIAMEPQRDRAGLASGLMGFCQLGAGTLLGTIIGRFAEQGPLPLALGIMLTGIIILPIFLRIEQAIQQAWPKPAN